MSNEIMKQGQEILRVTPEGEFIWHEDADRLIEEGDFTNSPAMPHILRKLRQAIAEAEKQHQPLSEEEAFKLVEQDFCMEEYADRAMALVRRTEAAHNIKIKIDPATGNVGIGS